MIYYAMSPLGSGTPITNYLRERVTRISSELGVNVVGKVIRGYVWQRTMKELKKLPDFVYARWEGLDVGRVRLSDMAQLAHYDDVMCLDLDMHHTAEAYDALMQYTEAAKEASCPVFASVYRCVGLPVEMVKQRKRFMPNTENIVTPMADSYAYADISCPGIVIPKGTEYDYAKLGRLLKRGFGALRWTEETALTGMVRGWKACPYKPKTRLFPLAFVNASAFSVHMAQEKLRIGYPLMRRGVMRERWWKDLYSADESAIREILSAYDASRSFVDMVAAYKTVRNTFKRTRNVLGVVGQ